MRFGKKSTQAQGAPRPVAVGFRLTFDIEVGKNCRLTVLAPDAEAKRRAEEIQRERVAFLEGFSKLTPEQVEAQGEAISAKMTEAIRSAVVSAEVKAGESWTECEPGSVMAAPGMDRAVGDLFVVLFFRGCPQVRLAGLE